LKEQGEQSSIVVRWIIVALMLAAAGCSGSAGAPAPESLGPNRPPIVDAGQPQRAQGGGIVVLKGSAVDPEGGAVRYRWRQTRGLGVALADPTSPKTSFEAPPLADGDDLEFELIVTDPSDLPAADTTTVAVKTGYWACAVESPPAGVDAADGFYQKYCDANGQPVLAPAEVPDRAVEWIRYQALEMVKRLPDTVQAMIGNGSRIVVKGRAQTLTDIPEYRDLYALYPDYDWDALPGVGAVTELPVTSTSEENVLCDVDDPYRGFSVFIHEFAHSIHLIGLRTADPTFESRLTQAYDTAMASGLWQNTYSATNRLEYWAEGVAIWFNAHWSSLDHPSVINTREKLAQYDDGLYRLVRDFFTEDTIPLCAPVAP
jgi:hypothetical protein